MTPEHASLIQGYPNVIDRGRSAENDLIIRTIVDALPGNCSVLDIGCNSGWLMQELAKKGCDCVGVEPAELPFRAAVSKGLNVVQAFGHEIPADDDSFDVCVLSTVSQQADDFEPIIREARRVCREGGAIVGVNATPEGDWGYKALGGVNPYVKSVIEPEDLRWYFPGKYDWRAISSQSYFWGARSVKPALSSIGVVMPVVNCLKYTQQAVRSFVTFYPYEFVVIDNGSTDGTADWFQTVDRPVVYLRQEENLGVARSWNLGIAEAFKRGHQACLVVNNDVVFAPDCIHNLIQWTDSVDFPTVHEVTRDPNELRGWPRDHRAIGGPLFVGFLMTRKVWDRVGPFDERFKGSYWEDMAYDHQLSLAGLSRAHCCDALVAHYGSRTRIEGGVDIWPDFNRNKKLYERIIGHPAPDKGVTGDLPEPV